MTTGATNRLLRAALSAVALAIAPAIAPGPVRAQDARAHRAVGVALDNDFLAPRGRGLPPDYDYTHGARLSVDGDVAPRWLSRLAGAPACRVVSDSGAPCLTTSLTLRQEIYTPRRDAPTPVAGERPYAGWLGIDAAVRLAGARWTHAVSLSLGVTGPPSGAEQVQSSFHRLLHNTPQEGWAHQLPAEPTVLAQYVGGRLFARGGGCTVARAAAYGGASLGSVLTGAQAGVRAWMGCAGASWTPVDPLEVPPLRLYLVGGYRQLWVARDLFVDGTAFRESVHADRLSWVGVTELGVGARLRHLSVEYRATRTGRQYRAQAVPHDVGTLAVILH